MKTYKFRIYPNNTQERKLFEVLNACRFLYNSALEERISFYQTFGKSRLYSEQQKFLPEIKDILPEYNNIYSQILQKAFCF